ncbi:MAG: tetratricopeptide repeat protein [Desulfobacterales bacterium]|nr:tetratricopeptide repeat protein [Desulfobacterales bacterium]MDJ0989233.1 tetratricopeptide repeat protein [Desulfobacterales bacterium]
MAKTAPGSGPYVKRQTLTTSVVLALMVGFVAGFIFGVYKSGDPLPGGAPGTANPGAGRAGMLAQLEERVRANPQDVEAWIQIGHINFDNGQHQAAIEAYEKALAINASNAPVLTDLGIMYRRSGNPEEAIRRFDQAIAVDPKLENPRFNKGIVLLHDLNDREGAIAAWEELLQVNPLAMAPNGKSVDQMVTEFKAQP